MGPIMEVKKPRPVNLDLQTFRFPITAIASIVHRVSGVIIFFAVTALLWLLSVSLSSEEGFELAVKIENFFFVKFILWGILTSLAYHIVGGIRHMIMDLGYCEDLQPGMDSAKAAFIITGILSVFAGVLVW